MELAIDRKPTIYAVDFDGTLVDHRYPDIGSDVPGAFQTLRDLIERGDRIILLTMRSDEFLDAAVKHCEERGVVLFGVNDNPEQATWTASRKVYAHHFIDDAAVGCPLRENVRMGGRPFVDWSIVRRLVGLDA